MTKGPFNALPSIIDLNAALLSFALTGYDGWLSSAGYVGPKVRVDHDISMLIPEVFSRMTAEERSASSLLDEGCLERVEDVEHEGETVRASRLGYRMTQRFATKYFGRIFLHPHAVFTPGMLRPELQDAGIYARSMAVIVETHRLNGVTCVDLRNGVATADADSDGGPEIDFYLRPDFWASSMEPDSRPFTRAVKLRRWGLKSLIAEVNPTVIVCDIEGGLEAWRAAGGPVAPKPQKKVSPQ